MTELKMTQAPRGIDEKTMLQHTFRFCEAKECFQSFRLVSKSWKDAVETIRFNGFAEYSFFHSLCQKLSNTQGQVPSYYEKYLKAFRKAEIDMHGLGEHKSIIFSLILNSMKKLNEIRFYGTNNKDPAQMSFMSKIIETSQQTLQILTFPTLILVSKMSFPKLKIVTFRIRKERNSLNDFQTHFPNALQNMENLETVELELHGTLYDSSGNDVCEYIAQNYAKHCISMNGRARVAPDELNYVGVKIFTFVKNLETLENKRHVRELQYLHVVCPTTLAAASETPMSYSWDRYREIFDECTNLKEIELICRDNDETIIDILPTLTTNDQQIWQERISYFNARQISLVEKGAIAKNEALKLKLAKEAGISWKFQLH
jgi:hypothetical protein